MSNREVALPLDQITGVRESSRPHFVARQLLQYCMSRSIDAFPEEYR